jgi:hypothetical protein
MTIDPTAAPDFAPEAPIQYKGIPIPESLRDAWRPGDHIDHELDETGASVWSIRGVRYS